MVDTAVGISKINKINNAGIFSNYTWPANLPDLSFKKINLVYGYNGSGKTTLSNIIGLLSEDHDEQEIKRIENGLSADPAKPVEIEFEWDGDIAKHPTDRKKLYVFNSAFVADHVYDGSLSKVKNFKQVVTKEQLSNPALRKVLKAIAIEDTKKTKSEGYIEELEKLFEEIKGALSKTWNENIDGKRMPSIKIENHPQEASKEKEDSLLKSIEEEFSKFKTSKNSEALEQAISDLNQITINTIDFPNNMAEIIVKSITENAREKVQKKIFELKAHTIEHSSIQNWLEDGANLLRQTKDGKECPLCDSALPNIETLITSYDAFFNDELTDLMREISNVIIALEDALVESLNRKDQSMHVQALLAEYNYQDLVTEVEQSALSRLKLHDIKVSINTVKKMFESKREAVDFIPSKEQLANIHDLERKVEQFSSDVTSINSVKEKILTRLQSARFDDKNAKAICVRLFWKRFDNQGKTIANEARKEQANQKVKFEIPKDIGGIALLQFFKKSTEDIMAMLAKKEDEKAVELSKIKKESEYVNELLARFCINNFTISTHDDDEITIHYSGVPPKRGIQYSLSEGEKTALAFAYFLSKHRHEVLDNPEVKKEDFIIVIDDPVSSLDENRLFSTALVIQDILIPKVSDKEKNANNEWIIKEWDGCKQIIILSHNIIFLKFMSSLIGSLENKVRADIYIEKGIISTLPNSLKNYQTSYFQKLEKLQAYIAGDIEHETAKDYLPNYIRIILEAFLSFKFARLRGKDKFLPAMLDSLIGMSTSDATMFDGFAAVSGITNTQTLKNVLLELKQKTNPESHGTTQDILHLEYLSENELKALAEQTLNVIQFLDQIHYGKVQELS